MLTFAVQFEIGDGESDIGEIEEGAVGDEEVAIGEGSGVGKESGEGDFEGGEDGLELGDCKLLVFGLDGEKGEDFLHGGLL